MNEVPTGRVGPDISVIRKAPAYTVSDTTGPGCVSPIRKVPSYGANHAPPYFSVSAAAGAAAMNMATASAASLARHFSMRMSFPRATQSRCRDGTTGTEEHPDLISTNLPV
jgi:hypothetical protein